MNLMKWLSISSGLYIIQSLSTALINFFFQTENIMLIDLDIKKKKKKLLISLKICARTFKKN